MSISPHYRFRDRTEAGRLLATKLHFLSDRPDVVVLGLPRGGVPVAYEIARILHVPLDICLVRKLGVPGQEELAMGAIAQSGVRVLNQELVDRLHISKQTIAAVTMQEQRELERRHHAYRGEAAPNDAFSSQVADSTIILVDDGIATGATLMAAIAILKRHQPARLVVAVPVAPPSVCRQLHRLVDQVICLVTPQKLSAIGCWYHDFSQVSDQEVQTLLQRAQMDRLRVAREIKQPPPMPVENETAAMPPAENPTGSETADRSPLGSPNPSETPPHGHHK
ncbi:MAG: phosphoribosyltransferase [Elainellaceae cyanobacterium]